MLSTMDTPLIEKVEADLAKISLSSSYTESSCGSVVDSHNTECPEDNQLNHTCSGIEKEKENNFSTYDDLNNVFHKSSCTTNTQEIKENYFCKDGNHFETIDLNSACKQGLVNVVERLIYNGVRLNQQDTHGMRPLLWACYQGHVDVVTTLILHGVQRYARDRNRRDCLIYACKAGHAEVVDLLLSKYGFHVETCDACEKTPLIHAADTGNRETVNVLLKFKADTERVGYNDKTPLMYACIRGNVETIEALLVAGASINAVDKMKKTALWYACANRREKAIELLLHHGADVNMGDWKNKSPLLMVYWRCSVDVLRSLVRCGAKPDMRFLWQVCKTKNEEMKELLLELRVDIDSRDDTDGKTVLIKAVIAQRLDVIDWLLKNGANVSLREHCSGKAAITYAFQLFDMSIIKLLISYGADIHVTDNMNKTLLMYLCEAQRKKESVKDLIKQLIQMGMDIDARDDNGMTALMHSARMWFVDSSLNYTTDEFYILVAEGASLDMQCNAGWTAAFYAVSRKNLNYLQKLMTSNADMTSVSNDGRNVLSVAIEHNALKCIQLLLERNEDREKLIPTPVFKQLDIKTVLFMVRQYKIFEWSWLNSQNFGARFAIMKNIIDAGICPGNVPFNGKRFPPLVAACLLNENRLVDLILSSRYFFPDDYRMLCGYFESFGTLDSDILKDVDDEILEPIVKEPMSLKTWSFIVASKAISLGGHHSLRSERVDSLPIPNALKRQLNFISI